MSNPNTGTAAEFYVLSILLRKSHEAYITIGNTKAIDIVSFRNGVKKTIDVKASEYDDDFIIGNVKRSKKADYETRLKNDNHFFVFVSFLGKIEDELSLPNCFVVPSTSIMEVCQFTSGTGGNQKAPSDPNLALNAKMKKLRTSRFANAWDLI